MTSLISDLRYGARMLLKTPLVTGAAILTLALGVGLTVQTFSVVYGSVMRSLPLEADERLMSVVRNNDANRVRQGWLPYADYLDFREQMTSFEDLAAASQGTINLAGDDDPPQRYEGGFVTANAFGMLGVPPHLGRVFREGEDRADGELLVVLGYEAWRDRFGSDPTVIDRSIRANSESATIIGVMPEGFKFPFDQDVWVNDRFDVDPANRRAHFMSTFGRVREDVTVEAAKAEAAAIMARIEAEFPEQAAGDKVDLIRYEEVFMPPEITAAIWIQLAAVFGVLLIACANVANLLLARASYRGKEVAIRSALGAKRGRVIRMMLLGSLLIAIVGGGLGVLGAKIGLDFFNASVADVQKPYWIDMRLDAVAAAFAFGVTMLASVLSGTLPAIRASGGGAAAILKDESRGASSSRLGRLSAILVIGEVAVSCALLIMAGMLIKSVINVSTVDLGFRTENILTARLGLFAGDYPERIDRENFFVELKDRLEAQPGVESAALTTNVPGTGAMRFFVAMEGEVYENDSDYPLINASLVTPDFFSAFDASIIQGRDFVPAESRSSADPVAIVNQSFAAAHFGDRTPLGRRVRLGREEDDIWVQIVGLVPDMHIGGGVGGLGSDQIEPGILYLAPGTFDIRFMSIILRTSGTPESAIPTARAVVKALDPNMPIYDVMSVDSALDQATWAFGIFSRMFTTLGVAALFLAAVGLYAVMAFSVAGRAQEIGIRMALGASAKSVLRLIMRRGIIQLAIGVTIGLALGALVSRPLRAVTFGVEPNDLSVFIAILVTIVATGVLATLIPALRAARIDPLNALRED